MGKILPLIVALGWAALPALPALADYGKIPLFFIENGGQVDERVRYMVKGADLVAYFSAEEIVLDMKQGAVRLRFPGSNAATIEGAEPLAGRANFLIGSEPEAWKTSLRLYRTVVYRGLYPGVDMLYSSSGRRLKSEFVVAPGRDPSAIRLDYGAMDRPRLDPGGALFLSRAGGELREDAPAIYQEIRGRRVPVEGGFRILADGSIGFWVGAYDRTQRLIIDPVISYSTFLGGSGNDAATGIAVDQGGNTYVAGWTDSFDFPTSNPLRAQSGGSVDAFVAKLNPGGTGLIYCTYLGGNGDDRAFGIAVDGGGNAYVTGWTGSSNFPTVSPLQSKLAGGRDAFVAKLNPQGSALVYSTYLGGGANDSGNGIAVDSARNAYVAGDTYSLNFPAISAFQTANRGQQDAFAAKLNAAGGLVYSTYLGGNGTDRGSAIAVDGAGNAYLTGATTSTNFPTAGGFQPNSAGNQDAFVTKLSPAGNVLVYSTYLGGSGGQVGAQEAGMALAVDASGSAYVAGATSSINFPVTANALQTAYSGGGDAFVSKLNPAGSALVYSTYLGGSSVDCATGIAVDFLGNAYVTGYTASYDFLTARPLQAGNAGLYDVFVAKLNPAGSALVWSTYLGGSGSDSANAVTVDLLGNAYIAGQSFSSDFPIRNGFQVYNSGSDSAFVAKIAPGWKAAVFSAGWWYVDANRNGGFDSAAAGDQVLGFGQTGDIPVAGDWDGSGTTKIGVFRNGQWLLDYNGNGVWDGAAGGDRLLTFGQAGDRPLVGDWNGSGTTKIGVFRNGYWMLDYNGNGQWDGTGGGDAGFWLGNAAYLPVVGDWNGTGTAKAGVFSNGWWYLDVNGDGQWVPGVDRVFVFGLPGDMPLAGDWDGSGKVNVGVYRAGQWILDMNGNAQFDGFGAGEASFWLGNAAYLPVLLR